MFSFSRPANLKIIGAEGHSPESLRDEVNRGARFVLYSYNFSLLVVSFKRPSSIYFIRAGESRFVKGLPFTLLSLTFGWWGLPWGIIYTFQSLYTNLGGGKDVTAELMNGVGPAPGGTAAGTAIPPALPPRTSDHVKRVLAVAGVVGGLVTAVIVGWCYREGSDLKVALVSGLPTTYVVELNGQKQSLVPGKPVVLTVSQGEFVLRGAPDGPGEQRFTFSTPFFSRISDQRVAIINPDRAAVVYRETTRYTTSSSADGQGQRGETFFVNQVSYYLPKADFFFEEFPQTVSMPSGAGSVTKSRFAAMHGVDPVQVAGLLQSKLGEGAALAYLENQVRIKALGEQTTTAMIYFLKPADAQRLFETHLADRPVRLEWHRGYQHFLGRARPDFDPATEYRRWAEAEPDNGDLLYLQGRVERDPVVAHRLFQEAVQAKQPSIYAVYALGYDAAAAGNYSEAIELIERAERAGVHTEALQICKRDTLLALGRTNDVVAGVQAELAKDPTNLVLGADTVRLQAFMSHDKVAGDKAVAAFLTGLRKHYGANVDTSGAEHFLREALAYGLGDEREAAVQGKASKGETSSFADGINGRDHAAAFRALAQVKAIPASYYWLLYLSTQMQGDAKAADDYFQKGLVALAAQDRTGRVLAEHIKAGTEADHDEVMRTNGFASENRSLFAAMGVRFPAQRERYFAKLREVNREPAFPYLLLRAVSETQAGGVMAAEKNKN